MPANEAPLTSNPQPGGQVEKLLGFVALAIIVVAANLLIYRLVSTSSFVKESGWRELLKESSAKEGNVGSGIVYEIEGFLINIGNYSVTIESNGKHDISTAIAKFTVVAPYSVFEEWPSKIIAENDKNSFKVGDKVVILIRGQRMADKFYVERVMKVQETGQTQQ